MTGKIGFRRGAGVLSAGGDVLGDAFLELTVWGGTTAKWGEGLLTAEPDVLESAFERQPLVFVPTGGAEIGLAISAWNLGEPARVKTTGAVPGL